MLTLLLATLSAAEAGFFHHDQYEPPSPKFGTIYRHTGLMAGVVRTPDLTERPEGGMAWTAQFGATALVLPAIELGVRGTLNRTGAAFSENEGDLLIGYRAHALAGDALLAVQLPVLRVYAYGTLLGGARLHGPFFKYDHVGFGFNYIFDERAKTGAVNASYRHFGIGLQPRWVQPARATSQGELSKGFGLLIEARYVTMAAAEPVAFAPNAVHGYALLASVAIDLRANGGEK